MYSFTDLCLFSLLWVETFLWPKFCVNQQPANEMTVSVSFTMDRGSGNHPWLWGRAERCCWEVPGTSGIPCRGRTSQRHLLPDWDPGSWTGPAPHGGTCATPDLLTGTTGNTESVSGVTERANPRYFQESYLGSANWCFWRKLCSSEKNYPQIFLNHSRLSELYLLVCLKSRKAWIKKKN